MYGTLRDTYSADDLRSLIMRGHKSSEEEEEEEKREEENSIKGRVAILQFDEQSS